MATTNTDHTNADNTALNGDHSTNAKDFEAATRGMSHEEKTAAQHAARFGYGPLAHMRTNLDASLPGEHYYSLMLRASSDEFDYSLRW
jgi:hypothetical protein